MNLGETLLVLGALVIFSITTLYLNDTKFDNNQKVMEAEFKTTAVGLAQSYIEEAQALAFDECIAIDTWTSLPQDFTDPGSLGSEASESYSSFDDVDDFNDYSTTINTPRASYTVNVFVSYADSATLTPNDANNTFFKYMTVKVSSIFFSDSIKLNYMFSYY